MLFTIIFLSSDLQISAKFVTEHESDSPTNSSGIAQH